MVVNAIALYLCTESAPEKEHSAWILREMESVRLGTDAWILVNHVDNDNQAGTAAGQILKGGFSFCHIEISNECRALVGCVADLQRLRVAGRGWFFGEAQPVSVVSGG